MSTICIVGLGYIGFPTALLLARAGHQVFGYDVNAEKIARLEKGVMPFEETGLHELWVEAHHNFFPKTEMVSAEIYVIAVPTPVTTDKKCDLSYVQKATEAVAGVIQKGSLVILESTVSPGTTEELVGHIIEQKTGFVKGKDFYLGYVSEKAIPGNTLHEMIHNDRIIGGYNPESTEKTRRIYMSFVEGVIHVTDCKTAETVKLVENAYRDVNIAFANELAKMSASLGMNVWEIIRLANKHPRVNVHAPGPGVGGHCIALDPWFLVEHDPNQPTLIPHAREVNDHMPEYVVAAVKKLAEKHGTKKIGILGVAYKKNVDDARETPAIPIIVGLEKMGFEVCAHDPWVKDFSFPLVSFETLMNNVEALVIITDHDSFKNMEFNNQAKWLLDTRGLYENNKDIGVEYYLLGREI